MEVCPVLVLPPEDLSAVKKTQLDHYTFNWPKVDLQTGKKSTTQAIALGVGSIFNHSRNPNVGFHLDLGLETITYTTLRDVEAGEELCISYGPTLWFDDADGGEDAAQRQETAMDVLGCIELELDARR